MDGVADAGCAASDSTQVKRRQPRSDGSLPGLPGGEVPKGRFACGQCGFVGSSRLSLSMHMTQAHRPQKAVRSRSKCPDARLYHRLRLSSLQERQQMLQRLSQVQRLSLERWILNHSEHCQEPVKKRKIGTTKNVARHSRKPLCAGVRQGKNRSRGYFVSTCCVGVFQLFARSAADLQTAKRQRSVLQELSRAVESERARRAEPCSLSQAFAEHVELRAQELRSVGFSFTVRVPAKYWIGRELRSPRYNLQRLHVGLQAFERLQRARNAVYRGHANRYSIFAYNSPSEMEVAWLHLRDEYLDVWAEAGWCRQELLRRLQRLEAPCKARHRAVASACRQHLAIDG